MKITLGLSLLLNLVLSYFVINQKTEEKVIERVIIETHGEVPKNTQVPKKPSEPILNNVTDKKKEIDRPDFFPLETHEFQDAGEKMESDRIEFLTEKLGLSENKLVEHNKLRDDFYKKTANFWKKNPMRELSFKERREMLSIEEELHLKLEKLHGKKNWERYQKYREEYNLLGFKRQTEDNQPFIFMGL